MSMMACIFVTDSKLIVASLCTCSTYERCFTVVSRCNYSSGPLGAADHVAASCPLAAAVPCAGSLTAENGTATALQNSIENLDSD